MINIKESEFDALMEKLSTITMENDGYIPTEEEIFDYIDRYPDRYYLYLLWFSEHKPKPKNEEEKNNLKIIARITNKTINIIYD